MKDGAAACPAGTGIWSAVKKWVYPRRITILRRTVATFIFVLLNSILFGMFSFGRDPNLRYVLLPNASCRYIVNAPTYCFYYPLQQWLQGGYTTAYTDAVLPILVLISLVILFGRAWCSWACPFGLLQEILMWTRNLFRIPHIQLSYRWTALLDQLKYAILFFTVLISISMGIPALGLEHYSSTLALPYCQVCPANGFFTLLQSVLGLTPSGALPVLAITILIFFLAGSFFIRMFWCRICPMGAFMAFFNKLSFVWLRKDPAKCTKCRICLRVCPQDFHTVYEEMEKENITGAECTLCGRCVESCPEKGALAIEILNKTVVESKPRR